MSADEQMDKSELKTTEAVDQKGRLGSVEKYIYRGCLILVCIFLVIAGVGSYRFCKMVQLVYADECAVRLGQIEDAKNQLRHVQDPTKLNEPVTWSELLKETDIGKNMIPKPPYTCSGKDFILGKLNELPRCSRKCHNERFMELRREWEAREMERRKVEGL